MFKSIIFVFVIILVACTPATESTDSIVADDIEIAVQDIPLEGNIARDTTEVSGMTWFNDTLLLVPQYAGDRIYAIPRTTLNDFFAGNIESITPDEFPFDKPNMNSLVRGYEGFEAIAINGETVYLTIEVSLASGMKSYLISGMIDENGIVLDEESLVEIPQPTNISNAAHETLVFIDGVPLAIYEQNENANIAKLITESEMVDVTIPTIPYRITDATTVIDNQFYVINYLFSGSGNKVSDDIVLQNTTQGATHEAKNHVERIVLLEWQDGEIQIVENGIHQLRLTDAERNWEGIARYADGVLIATDKFPDTILSYVPLND